jgi:hypothetical protein
MTADARRAQLIADAAPLAPVPTSLITTPDGARTALVVGMVDLATRLLAMSTPAERADWLGKLAELAAKDDGSPAAEAAALVVAVH